MTIWHVFVTSDAEGDKEIYNTKHQSMLEAKADVFDQLSKDNGSTILYKNYRFYELFEITPKDKDTYYVFIMGIQE